MFACFAAGALATGCEYEIDQPEPPYAELKPDPWLADVFREEMRRLGREPVAREFEAGLPMGSTDMGNVTQVLPGIHPVVGVDAGGATVHQRAFAAAAAGPSADRAVVEGAIMLARTVVRLAQTSAQRDRVYGRARPQKQRGTRMSLAETAESWLAAHDDDLVEWRRHMHRYPELGRQEYATTQFVAERLADAGLNPKALPGGTGLVCDLGPERRAQDRAAGRHRRAADGRADRRPVRVDDAQRRARLRARRAHRDTAGYRAGVGVGAGTAGRGAADLPGRRGADARRGDRRHRRRRDQRGVADLRPALRSPSGGRPGRGAAGPHHVGRRLDRDRAVFAGRAHLASAFDRRPGLRARHA